LDRRGAAETGSGVAAGNWVGGCSKKLDSGGCRRKLGCGGAAGKWVLGAFWVPLVHYGLVHH